MNFFDSEKATKSHTVELVNVSSSAHCSQHVKQSTCSSVMLSDAMPVVKDESEQAVEEADDSKDIDSKGIDADVTRHIDSVFFACDPTGTGTVAVCNIIAYLSDTLHVSNCGEMLA